MLGSKWIPGCSLVLKLLIHPILPKPLEVKLANQESDLVALLKRLPLGPMELGVIRDKAEKMRLGTLKSRGEALLPLMLASFLFDALVIAGKNLSNIFCVIFLYYTVLFRLSFIFGYRITKFLWLFHVFFLLCGK